MINSLFIIRTSWLSVVMLSDLCYDRWKEEVALTHFSERLHLKTPISCLKTWVSIKGIKIDGFSNNIGTSAKALTKTAFGRVGGSEYSWGL